LSPDKVKVKDNNAGIKN